MMVGSAGYPIIGPLGHEIFPIIAFRFLIPFSDSSFPFRIPTLPHPFSDSNASPFQTLCDPSSLEPGNPIWQASRGDSLAPRGKPTNLDAKKGKKREFDSDRPGWEFVPE